MLKRWFIYILEGFKPQVLLTFTILLNFAIHGVLQVLGGENRITFSQITLVGIISSSLFILYVRVCDESKDYEVDKKYFPTRPVPAGKVTLKDLRVLKHVTVALLLLVNILWPAAIYEFLLVFMLFYLMGKWFFLPVILSRNRILAFLTHSPVYLFMNYYLIALYSHSHGIPALSLTHVYVALWFWLPGLTWEFARKTRAPDEEQEGYQTYSQMMGYKAPVFIAAGIVMIHVLMTWWIAGDWKIAPGILIALAVSALFFCGACLSFLVKPVPGNTHFRTMSQVYHLVSVALIVFDLLLL